MIVKNFNAKRAITVVGYPRSGQHAISHWLFCQYPELGLFLNNYSENIHTKVWYAHGEQHINRPLKSTPITLLGFGLEGNIDRPILLELPRVIVIRDIKNNLASLLKHGGICHKEYVMSWKKFILHAMGIESFCVAPNVVVNFPKWHMDVDYRRDIFGEICKMIGINVKFTDAGRNFVTGSGGGSSFDKNKFKNTASQMDILNRYKHFKDHEKMKNLPKELLRLNLEYFGKDIYK